MAEDERVGVRPKMVAGFVGASILVVLLATAVVVAGPSDEVVCGTGSVPDRLAQGVIQPLGGGHIDAVDATLCVVPSPTTWLVGTLVLVVGLGAVLLVARRAKRG
jgi:hypothetical protein